MKITANQLQQHLQKKLSPIYLITGDDPLLMNESRDAIRKACQINDFNETSRIEITKETDWYQLIYEAKALSLFSSKGIIEIHSNNKFGSSASKILLEYVQELPPHKVLLLISNKLDASAQKTKWFNTIEQHGTVVQIWPIDSSQLPQWLQQRLSAAGIKTTTDGIRLLIEHTEGNLLAATQEIEKLKLLHGEKEITPQQIAESITQNSRFNIFQWMDIVLQGDYQRIGRALYSLKQEGTEPTLVLWALTREIRQFIEIFNHLKSSQNIDTALHQKGIWEKRKPLFKRILQIQSIPLLERLLLKAENIDNMIKGLRQGFYWDELLLLSLQLAGANFSIITS